MKHIKGIVLCEGDSDMVLLGSYISQIKKSTYMKQFEENPFPGEKISWYSDESDNVIGIWDVGGNNFTPKVQKIMKREIQEHQIESVIVVTDYDDEEAAKERPEEIYRAINDTLKIDKYDILSSLEQHNKWQQLYFRGGFSQRVMIRYCYLLVPYDSQGALETFMLTALSEKSASKKEVIIQVKDFIGNFKSTEYLQKRREKIKGELSVSVAIFNPTRMFDLMNELIKQIDWSVFDQTEKQFGILKEI